MEFKPWNVLTRTFKQNPKTSGNTKRHGGTAGWVTRGRFFAKEPFGKGGPEQCVSGVSKTRTKQLVTWLCGSLTDNLEAAPESCPDFHTSSARVCAQDAISKAETILSKFLLLSELQLHTLRTWGLEVYTVIKHWTAAASDVRSLGHLANSQGDDKVEQHLGSCVAKLHSTWPGTR